LFAESEEEYLNFRLNESNMLDMLETPYLQKLQPLVKTHLVGENALPVFLSALTLELYQRTTAAIN